MFVQLRTVLDTKSLAAVYHALVQSILQYCVVTWGGISKYLFERVTKIQKLILKVIYRKPRLFSSKLLFEISGVLDVRQLFIKFILIHYKFHRRVTGLRHDHDIRLMSNPLT